MGIDPVTSRWAQALFNVAERDGALDDVQRDMEQLGRESVDGARLRELLPGFHPLTRNFVQLLFLKDRQDVLETVAEAFRQHALEQRGVVEGVVEAPRALGSSELGKLEQALAGRLGKEVVLASRVNEDLVAGVRVFVGSRMLDQSVQGRLEDLRKRLEAAPLPA